MKLNSLLPCIILVLINPAWTRLRAAEGTETKLNELTAVEKADGWHLLFDGKTTQGWRSFKKQTFPEKGWVVEEGVLNKVPNVRGGDIISADEFTDFDFQWEWRIPSKANNGIKYFITEERSSAVGHEYQMIDDSLPRLPKKEMTASFYDVLPPTKENLAKPPGEWNHSRVRVQGNHVEHWLNGSKALEYELGSEEVKAAVANSKFKNVKEFGTKIKGHILLTDHNSGASYRNVKIRELPAK